MDLASQTSVGCICRALVLVLLASASLAASAQTPAGSIHGRVVRLGSGTPQIGVEVELLDAPDPTRPPLAHAFTDEDGRFVFENLPAESYLLQISSERLRLLGDPNPSRPDVRVTLETDQATSEVLLQLVAGGAAILGTLSDAGSSASLTAWRVTLLRTEYGQSGSRIAAFATREVSEDGEFAFTGLDPGEYFLRAEPGADQMTGFARTYYPNGVDLSLAAPLRIRENSLTSLDYEVSVRSLPRVTGRYINDLPTGRGRWVWASLVSVLQSMDPIPVPWQPFGDEPGAFEIPNIVPGTYDLFTSDSPGPAGAVSRTRVQMGSETLRGVAAVAKPGFEVAGTFGVDSREVPVDWTRVSITLTEVNGLPLPRLIRPDSSGNFVFPDVPDADYMLRIELPREELPAGTYVDRALLNGVDVLHSVFRVQQPGTLNISLRTDGGVVMGRTTPASGEFGPSRVVLVPLRRPGPNADFSYRWTRFVQEQDGGFTIANVRPGEYTLLDLEQDPRCNNYCYLNEDYLRNALSHGERVAVGQNSTVYRDLETIPLNVVDPLWD